jgi:A/G-specific adenine glycosylase
MFNIQTPLPDSKDEIKSYAASLTPVLRAGDYAQALMDLGATICTPKALKCNGRCPWEQSCISAHLGTSADLPFKKKKAAKPTRRGYAFWAEYKGYIWLCRRPEKGLLGGMMEIPSTDWTPSNTWDNIPDPQVPIIANWQQVSGLVRHTFTHFHLELKVIRLDIEEMINLQEGSWCRLDELERYALPTVMMKIIEHLREPVLDL